jgi:hypothetical protein
MKVAWNAAKHPECIGYHLLGDLKHPLRLVDRRRNGGRANHIGLEFLEPGRQILVGEIICHRIDEVNVGEACVLEVARQIGDPGRRPVAGDLSAARVIVRMNEYNAHAGLPSIMSI